MSAGAFSIANVNNLFKIKYGKLSENVYNSANVMLARQKKKYDFTGRQMFVPVPTSFAGGVGSGTLPTANHSVVEDAIILAKKVYARALIDRESMKAASNDEGAFVRATKWKVQKSVESYMRNASRILFGDGTGALGTIDGGGVTDNGGGDYDLVISAATFLEANWEEQDYVNIGTGSSDLFEVITVDPATLTINVLRFTGATVPAPADVIFMQGSENNDPQGFKGVFDFSVAAAGSLYTVPFSRRWSSPVEDKGGAGLTTDFMNELMLSVERRSGKVPNLIVASYTQFRKLLNLLESQKEYQVTPRMPELKGKVSFRGIEFMSTAGAVPVFPERFMKDDEMFFINDNFMDCHHRPGFGWFDDDGTVLLRAANEDEYEARYGGYYENYICPAFHGALRGLAI
jgi:hypothetical protein